ncbi:hypothetical protein F5Y10DRAFT_286310 [Nemania abortiva]|nr:hypothetical protein F5Y10DRAFT_286310 [Nemania abortiva]
MDPPHKLTTEVCRRELAADFDDDMVQDAMAIILLPTQHTSGIFSDPLCLHYMSWEAQILPNPLRRPDDECDDTPSDDLFRLYRLHSRLLLFIEDYLTKATAVDPSREYFCLSPLSPDSQYLRYMGHPLCPRFSAAALTSPERQRLFRAFLRYELLCKMFCSDHLGDGSWYLKLSSLWKYKGRAFQQVEAEAIKCVQSYVESLHKAILIQCESHDEFFMSDLLSGFSCFGFDLATVLLQAATAGKQGRDHVQMWFHDVSERYLRMDSDWEYRNCIPCTKKISTMQRDQAWAFLDNLRFHPTRLQQLCFTDADWYGPEKLRDLHDRPVDEHPHDTQIQLEYPTPPFLQGNRFVGLAPFWQ